MKTMNNEATQAAKNTTAGINEVIARRIQDVKDLVRIGWTKEKAIEYVRNSSTLGAKSWSQVEEAV